MDVRSLVMVALTLMIWSFLYKENIFYRFAEKTFLAVTAAQLLGLQLQSLWAQDVSRIMNGEIMLILPTILGLFYLLRISNEYRWISTYSIAILLGTSLGLAVRVMPWTVERSIIATLLPFNSINNILIVIGVVATLFYFYFMRKPGGIPENISKIGRGFIMINFGAIAAGVLLTRLTYLVERTRFILEVLGLIA